MEGYFPSMYLTVIALGQGIALALLFSPFGLSTSLVLKLNWPKYVVSIIVVLAIWHHYMYGSIFTRWFPDLRDSFLPIALFGSEIFLILTTTENLSRDLWPHSIWVLSLFSCLAYANAGYRCDPNFFTRLTSEDAKLHCRNIRTVHGYYASTFCGILTFVCFFFAIIGQQPKWYSKAIMVIFIIHFTTFEIIYIWRVKKFFRQALRNNDSS